MKIYQRLLVRIRIPLAGLREEKELVREGELEEHFAVFEKALYSLIGQYFVGKREVDAVLQQANRTTD